MFSAEELSELMSAIEEKISIANRTGKLEDILLKLGMDDWVKNKAQYESYKEGIIVVIGESKIGRNSMEEIARDLGIKNKFEYCLEYEDAKSYDYKKLQYAPTYRVVLFGPVAHKTVGTGDYQSVIAKIEHEDGYPRIERVGGKKLKITRSSYTEVLQKLIDEDYIAVNS